MTSPYRSISMKNNEVVEFSIDGSTTTICLRSADNPTGQHDHADMLSACWSGYAPNRQVERRRQGRPFSQV